MKATKHNYFISLISFNNELGARWAWAVKSTEKGAVKFNYAKYVADVEVPAQLAEQLKPQKDIAIQETRARFLGVSRVEEIDPARNEKLQILFGRAVDLALTIGAEAKIMPVPVITEPGNPFKVFSRISMPNGNGAEEVVRELSELPAKIEQARSNVFRGRLQQFLVRADESERGEFLAWACTAPTNGNEIMRVARAVPTKS